MLVLVLVLVISISVDVEIDPGGRLIAAAGELAGLRSMVVVAWLVTDGRSIERDTVVVWPSSTVKVGSEGCTKISAGCENCLVTRSVAS